MYFFSDSPDSSTSNSYKKRNRSPIPNNSHITQRHKALMSIFTNRNPTKYKFMVGHKK